MPDIDEFLKVVRFNIHLKLAGDDTAALNRVLEDSIAL